jgi:hypothetical protein
MARKSCWSNIGDFSNKYMELEDIRPCGYGGWGIIYTVSSLMIE